MLNIERYERIESCTQRFRTTSLPGLKILLYNQTDVALSSQEGVNVPPGYSMDIPFRLQNVKSFDFLIKQNFSDKNLRVEIANKRQKSKKPFQFRNLIVPKMLELVCCVNF